MTPVRTSLSARTYNVSARRPSRPHVGRPHVPVRTFKTRPHVCPQGGRHVPPYTPRARRGADATSLMDVPPPCARVHRGVTPPRTDTPHTDTPRAIAADYVDMLEMERLL
jgi:hypothetical protein